VPWLAIGLGAAALAGGVYLLLRPRTAGAATPGLGTTLGRTQAGLPAPRTIPETVLTPPGPSGLNPPSSGTIGPNGPDPDPALVDRLRASDQARQIFALQAMLYSAGFADPLTGNLQVPDGIEGPITDRQIARINQLGSYSSEPGRFTNRSIMNADGVLQAQAGGSLQGFGLQLLPFTLPQDVLDAVNSSAAAVDTFYPSVQARPQISPAGQAYYPGSIDPASFYPNATGVGIIPYPGMDRPRTVLPSNTVGANPGYGVFTDPRGLNIGLWQQLEGRFHSPLGTGVLHADVNANPVAGQRGGYWAGYPGAMPRY
jgi:hypothetical protein